MNSVVKHASLLHFHHGLTVILTRQIHQEKTFQFPLLAESVCITCAILILFEIQKTITLPGPSFESTLLMPVQHASTQSKALSSFVAFVPMALRYENITLLANISYLEGQEPWQHLVWNWTIRKFLTTFSSLSSISISLIAKMMFECYESGSALNQTNW